MVMAAKPYWKPLGGDIESCRPTTTVSQCGCASLLQSSTHPASCSLSSPLLRLAFAHTENALTGTQVSKMVADAHLRCFLPKDPIDRGEVTFPAPLAKQPCGAALPEAGQDLSSTQHVAMHARPCHCARELLLLPTGCPMDQCLQRRRHPV